MTELNYPIEVLESRLSKHQTEVLKLETYATFGESDILRKNINTEKEKALQLKTAIKILKENKG